MKDETIIELIEPTPKLLTRKCRLIAKTLQYTLQTGSVITALTLWYIYDYFIAGAGFLMMFIVMGIIRSKLRNSAIPLRQREYHYNDEGISIWYTARYFCNEKERS